MEIPEQDGGLLFGRILSGGRFVRHHNAGSNEPEMVCGVGATQQTGSHFVDGRTCEYRTIASLRRSLGRLCGCPYLLPRTEWIRPGKPAGDILWYLPSIGELIGTWISSSSTASQLSAGYWSSTACPDADEAFVITNEGKVYSDAVGNTHAVRGFQDPVKASHASN